MHQSYDDYIHPERIVLLLLTHHHVILIKCYLFIKYRDDVMYNVQLLFDLKTKSKVTFIAKNRE